MKITVSMILFGLASITMFILSMAMFNAGNFLLGTIWLATAAFAYKPTRDWIASNNDIEFSGWLVALVVIGSFLGGLFLP